MAKLTRVRQSNVSGMYFYSIDEMKEATANHDDLCVVASFHKGSGKGGGEFIFKHNVSEGNNITSFDGIGGTWFRCMDSNIVSLYEAGYSDGEDAALYISGINKAGYDVAISGQHTYTSTIDIDLSKGGLKGVGKVKLEDVGTEGYALHIYNSSSSYADRDWLNATNRVSGISFTGTGKRAVAFGKTGSGDCSELMLDNCGFIGLKGIHFLDNSYRLLFLKCTISRSFINTVTFNSPVNSGEVIRFFHCWMVDNGGAVELNNGQFIFDGTSLPAGQKAGYSAPEVQLKDNATVVFTNGNIEFQPNQSFVAFVASGQSRLTISNSTLLLASGYKAIPIIANDGAVVSLKDCSLPLYDMQVASGAATRQLIGGNSKAIMSSGCYPRAGFIESKWNLGNIVSPHLNVVANPSATNSAVAGWKQTSDGSGSPIWEPSSQVPNDQMFSKSFRAVAGAGLQTVMYQDIPVSEAGRYVQFGFWAKKVSGLLDAKLNFLTEEGSVKQYSYRVEEQDSWNFYAVIVPVPPNTRVARIEFTLNQGKPQEQSEALLHNIIFSPI